MADLPKNRQIKGIRLRGGGFTPIILETLIMRYGLKGKGRTRPDFFYDGFGSMCTILPM